VWLDISAASTAQRCPAAGALGGDMKGMLSPFYCNPAWAVLVVLSHVILYQASTALRYAIRDPSVQVAVLDQAVSCVVY